MSRKSITKAIATLLAFVLSFANVALLGSSMGRTYAATNLEEQTTAVGKAEIEFDAYFQEEGQAVHTKNINVGEDKDTLYLSIKVKEGYLTNANIKVNNANFKIQEANEKLDVIQSISAGENKITLNQISKGESVVLDIPIKVNTDSNFDVNDLSKKASITLEGTYTNNKGKEIEVKKTIETETTIDGTAESTLSQEILKYVAFDVNGNKGVILQTSIKSKIVDNKLPVKMTELEIEIPTINKINPKVVKLTSKNTMATNGQGGKVFTEGEDYTYKDGKVVLTINNNEEILSWMKNVEDEIILTCIYEEKAIVEKTDIELNAKTDITYYAKEQKHVVAKSNEKVELTKQIGDIVTLEENLSKTDLYKGYMLEEKGANTEFVSDLSINIGYAELVDNLVFKDETSYLDENGNEYQSKAIYTYTKISEENLLEILGEDGYIRVYGNDGKQITTLNKENLEYKYEEGILGVTFETSKPITEGILKVENGRQIESLEYSRKQEEAFTSFKVNLKTDIVKDKKVILTAETAKEIKLENPTSKAEIKINNPNISTVVKNEGVELRVTLKTTSPDSALYADPKLEIVLPSYITNIDVENVRLVYEKELKITNAVMYKNETGNIVIKIDLSGEQKEYNVEALTEGATLIMNTNIIADTLTPTKADKIYLNITNAHTDEKITESTDINFVAPAGMVTVNQISGYNDSNEKAISISGQKEVGEISTQAAARQATVSMTVINNYNYNCDNITILGRTPFKGNKTIKSGEDLGSTFTAKVISQIQTVAGVPSENITVYYSSNGEASKDLSDTKNGWTKDSASLQDIKSYMIVINDYTLKTGDIIGFNYNVEIPEGLERNQSTYGIFTVYYTRQEDENKKVSVDSHDMNESVRIAGTSLDTISANIKKTLAKNTVSEESAEATPTGVTTGEGPNLEVTLDSNVENNAKVSERQKVNYTAKVKNNSKFTAKGVNLRIVMSENALLILEDGKVVGNQDSEALKIQVGTIEPGQTKEVTFTLMMASYRESTINANDLGQETIANFNTNKTREDFETNAEFEDYKSMRDMIMKLKEEEKVDLGYNDVIVKAVAEVQGYNDIFTSNERKNVITSAADNPVIDMTLSCGTVGNFSEGISTQYILYAHENTTKGLKNVKITCEIPEGIKFDKANNDGKYDEKTRTVTWNYEKFTSTNLVLDITVEDLPDGVYDKEIPVTFKATYEGKDKTFESNTITRRVVTDGISISQTGNIKGDKIYQGDEVTYEIKLKNLSEHATSVIVKDYLPSELTLVKCYYTRGGKTVTVDGSVGETISTTLTLNAKEELTIYVKAKVEEEVNTSKEVTNKVELSSSEIEKLEANEITYTLIAGKRDPNNPNPGEDKDKYTITGTAWLDKNKDGKRDDGEDLLAGIDVYLLRSKDNRIVTKTTTNQSGGYTFSGIESGKYIVAFEYDTKKYDLSPYQADGVDDTNNSDVINMELTLAGKTANYAVTNTIELNSNTYNIDLGLVDSPKFDLELKKSISLVQVSNNAGAKDYKFDKTDFAKVEIAEKNMKGSIVAITYTFEVTNTGAVAGYVNKVVDYKDGELDFSSTLNPEWYQDASGNIYNTTLAGEVINPGETKELSLILTKTMTNENTGVSNNSAEIAEASNDLGLEDIDSTPGNKNTEEDDFGSADIVITVKTGGILFYGGIILIVLAIFAFGAYEINKRVLRKI